MKRALAVAVLILGVSACQTPIPTDPVERAAYFENLRREDLYEGVLRHVFEQNYTALQQNAKAYFILIDDQNPSPEFLKRFRDLEIPVKTRSRSIDGVFTEPVRDRDNLKNYGVIFMLSELKFTAPDDAEIIVRHYETPAAQSTIKYQLRRSGSTWRVTRETPIRLI